MSKRLPASERVRAEVMIGQGRPHTEIAREFGIAESTVRKWRDQLVAAAPPRLSPGPPAHMLARASEPEEPGAFEGLDVEDLEGFLQRMLEETLKGVTEAKRDGNHTAAQRGMKAAGDLTAQLRKAKADRRAGSDVLTLSKAEIDLTMRKLEDRAAGILARPLRCAHCQRELSIAYATEVKEIPINDRDDP